MTDRPTPEQLADWLDEATGLYAAEQFLDRLETEGYVIVHPDDVHQWYPDKRSDDVLDHWMDGWNRCRARVFGEATND